MSCIAKVNETSPALQDSRTDSDIADTLSHSLPSRNGRTWSEFFKETSKHIGLATAMTGAGLGLTGLADGTANKAHAGLVISGDPNADQRAQDNGFGYSVEGGGNVGWLSVTSTFGTRYASVVFIDPYTALTSAHGVSGGNGAPETYAFGTSANYNNGALFTARNIIIHPDYGGAAGQGIDLAVIKFDVPINLNQNLTIPSQGPAIGEVVWAAGYGVHGNPVDGYLGQDGAIRAGVSRISGTAPLLGGSSEYYRNSIFTNRLTNPNGMRLTEGHSGNGGIDLALQELWGIGIGGNLDPDQAGSMFLLTSPPVISSFIETNRGPVAVPEPASSVLLGSFAAAGAAYGLFRRKRRQDE